MACTITETLSLYGFTTLNDGSFFWGSGSLVWGYTVKVKPLVIEGIQMYEISIHKWEYDSFGEPVVEETKTKTLYAGLALAYIFQNVPYYFWKRGTSLF